MLTVLKNQTFQDCLLIIVVSILGLLLLVANPGYYSHDELQKLDHLERYGFFNYLSNYVFSLNLGNHFGHPVRPISFFVQGVLAFAMRDFPVAVHLFDVLTHGVVAILVYLTLLRFGLSRVLALGSACIFSLNPMAVIAVGWSAALMDRWYTLFGILAFMFSESYIRGRSGIATLGLVFIFVLAAILSKETAIMLPGLMLIFVLIDFSVLRKRRFWNTCAVFVFPVILCLLYRLPSILSSFESVSGGPYAASPRHIFENLLVYFAYPFLYGTSEAHNWVFVNKTALSAAVVGHFAMIAVLWFANGWRITLGYLFFYIIFLFPVLFIPSKGAHYLYASSIFFSILITWLIVTPTKKFSPNRLLGVLALVLVLFHSAIVQLHVYRSGACMDKVMTSIESVHLSLGRPNKLELRAEPLAPEYILRRFSTGRDKIGDSYPIKMTVGKWTEPKLEGIHTLSMNRECTIYVIP
jgi:hypothetical protein